MGKNHQKAKVSVSDKKVHMMDNNEMKDELSSPIAYGRTAEIYPWQDGQVLKLFHDWFGLESIEYERRLSQAVHASGLPVPDAGEIIQVNERNGLIYERVDGVSMLDVFERKPWNVIRYARQMAELHAAMHQNTVEVDIPDQRERIKGKISQAECLSDELRARLFAALELMPGGNQLCHGDFHPGNIMVSGRNVIIIDWIDSSLGNPLSDLARTSIIILGAVKGSKNFSFVMRTFVLFFHRVYLRHYFKLRPGGMKEYKDWLPIVAGARLNENIKELEPWLLAQAEKV